MQRTSHRILTTIVGAAVFTLAAHGVWAQGSAIERSAQADPARWYQEDVTPRARFETSKKEAGAAYREAQSECKKAAQGNRAACMQEAHDTFRRDMTDARQKIGSARS